MRPMIKLSKSSGSEPLGVNGNNNCSFKDFPLGSKLFIYCNRKDTLHTNQCKRIRGRVKEHRVGKVEVKQTSLPEATTHRSNTSIDHDDCTRELDELADYFESLGHQRILTEQQQPHDNEQDQLERITITGARVGLPTMFICLSMMVAVILSNSTLTEGVDCFKCSSRNGSNPACEDPFHNLNTTRITSPVLPDPSPNVIYHTPCYAGKKGREGLFPASACIKLTGTFDATGETLVVRHCALDSGTLTQDTELARMSHCGKFNFDGDSLKGCVLACPEDACNSAPSSLILHMNLGRLSLSNLATLSLLPLLSVIMTTLLSGTIQLTHCV